MFLALGHLLKPTDPESEDHAWIAQIWQDIISRPVEIIAPRLSFGNMPAVGRITVSSPAVARPFTGLNDREPYRQKIKPFNFLLTSHVKPFGHPTEPDPEHFHLIAPYEADSRRWLKMKWIDQYSGNEYSITTDAYYRNGKAARQDLLLASSTRALRCMPTTSCPASSRGWRTGSPCTPA
jgi:hypothetical protein